MDLDVHTALDLEDGLAHLERVMPGRRAGGSTLGVLRERAHA